jgi:protein O-GlcNAc transferase
LIFTPGIKSFADHLARHRLADLFLDTHPYNAHTTASDALWAGLPVLTVLGKSFTARVCASVLSAIGLSELVAESIEKYEELAIQIGNNPEAIKNLKLKLDRNRLTTPLFNSKQFTHDLEDIFQKIFESKKYEGDFIGQYTLRDFTPQ